MSYRYQFDEKRVGDLRLMRPTYEIVLAAYRELRDALEEWNQRALRHGGAEKPYKREVDDLNRMIEWGDEQLAHGQAWEIAVKGISVGSMRYAKAALMLMMHRQRRDRAEKSDQGWPHAALLSLDEAIDRTRKIADRFPHDPSDVLWELIPRDTARQTETTNPMDSEWDVFVSHASEDKEFFARPLAQALQARGLSVWFDDFSLAVGDSLRRSIDHGLSRSRFGVVVISLHFLNKEWPQKELDGLVAREVDGAKVILPVRHNITADQVRAYSPILADRLAALSSSGLEKVADDLALVITRATFASSTARSPPSARRNQ